MQPLTRCNPSISVISGATGFTLLRGLRLVARIGQLE